MSHRPQNDPAASASATATSTATSVVPRRRRYERPRIVHRESLEAMAAECTGFPGGKSDPTCQVGFS